MNRPFNSSARRVERAGTAGVSLRGMQTLSIRLAAFMFSFLLSISAAEASFDTHLDEQILVIKQISLPLLILSLCVLLYSIGYLLKYRCREETRQGI